MTLEGVLGRILSENYGIEVEEDFLYVGSRFDRDAMGGRCVKVLYLARWRDGEAERESSRWIYAADLEETPGVGPVLCAILRRADRMRVERGW